MFHFLFAAKRFVADQTMFVDVAVVDSRNIKTKQETSNSNSEKHLSNKLFFFNADLYYKVNKQDISVRHGFVLVELKTTTNNM